jgi:hypothetical protein
LKIWSIISISRSHEEVGRAYQVLGLDRAVLAPVGERDALLRLGLAGEGRVVDLEVRRAEEDEVGGGLVAHADEDDVALDEVRRGHGLERAGADDAARGRDHGEEGRENRLGLLELVELDERVEERDGDEDPAEVRVRKVVLEVDAEEDVLEDAGDDEQHVEERGQAVEVLLQRRLLLRRRELVRAVAREARCGLLRAQADRAGRVLGVDRGVERRGERGKGERVLGEVDVPHLVVLGLLRGLRLGQRLVQGLGERAVLDRQLAPHLEPVRRGAGFMFDGAGWELDVRPGGEFGDVVGALFEVGVGQIEILFVVVSVRAHRCAAQWQKSDGLFD